MSDHTPLSSHEISLLTNRLDWGGSWDGIDLNSLGTNCPLDNGRIKARKRKSTKHGGLGALHILPSEILCRVFGFLDLQSLADIRAVNWSIRDFVDGIPQYKLIIKHAPNALRALLSTERAESFTLFDLFRTLHTPDCSICGEFGALLDLFSCRRQCVKCATVSGENATMPLNTAKTKFKLTSNVFRQLPVCHTLPGDYKYSRPITAPPYKRRMRLVRVRSVADAIKKHGLSSSELEAWRDGNIGLHYTEREKYGRVAYSVMALMGRSAMESTAKVVDMVFHGGVSAPAVIHNAAQTETGCMTKGVTLNTSSSAPGPRKLEKSYPNSN
ncbi:MAG: hypothetical protein M1814_003618 [Vezdaea aestivalis]|nr:MAG: hypothetical protein M1814_003618 [Vezdaea aestivalis]